MIIINVLGFVLEVILVIVGLLILYKFGKEYVILYREVRRLSEESEKREILLPPREVKDSVKELGRKVVENKKEMPPLDISIVQAQGDNWIRTKNKKANILIPQNLSEEERQIVKDFYDL